MFYLWFLVFLLPEGSADIFTDLNCTVLSGPRYVYLDTAFNCDNNLADTTCITLYPPKLPRDTPPIFVAGNYPNRPFNCFAYPSSETIYVEALKTVALQNCPKRCGYCCQTPAFTCRNAQFPRLNCGTITRSQCLSPEWRTIIASDCPAACGFCLTGGCVDAIPNCSNDVSICMSVGMQDFVNKNCQLTCGRCPSTTAASLAAAPCSPPADSSTSCALWKANGFCTNAFYTMAQKKAYCGRTCGIC